MYNLENLCCLDKVPESGATLLVLPPAAAGATGFPVRVVALVNSASSCISNSVAVMFCLLVCWLAQCL